MLDVILTAFASWLRRMRASDCLPDPFGRLGPRELADLPAYHPTRDDCGCP